MRVLRVVGLIATSVAVTALSVIGAFLGLAILAMKPND